MTNKRKPQIPATELQQAAADDQNQKYSKVNTEEKKERKRDKKKKFKVDIKAMIADENGGSGQAS